LPCRCNSDAEPDDEQWRENDARDCIQQRHDRLEQLGDERNQRGNYADDDADHDADTNPASAAVNVASRCGQMRPLAKSSLSAPAIRLGLGT
jgi:hypothetical protein